MFDFFKKKKSTELTVQNADDEKKKTSIDIGVGLVATESARVSTQAAAQKFAKPAQYNRNLLDDHGAKIHAKIEAFQSGVTVRDPYTGNILTLTKAEARIRYGENYTNYFAESDHIIPLERRYEQTKDNPWQTTENVKKSSNSSSNIEVTSSKYNNAKRNRTNEEFVTDEEYLKQKGIKLTKQGKEQAISRSKSAQAALTRQDFLDSTKNILQTGHNAGLAAAKSSGLTGLTMSGIMNLTAVIKGEKSAEDAISDIAADTGKATVTGYFMGNGLTVVSHSISGSSSGFIKALTESNVPGKIITAVIVTGDTLKRYADGEITTQECLIQLGEKGLNMATTGYSMAIGQALIPIPIVGAAVGALVGSMLTSNYYNQLMSTLRTKELEHFERLRIIEECEKAAEQARLFRAELEEYLSAYFREYQDCFDEALSTIHSAFASGDADGVIAGANQITAKLGGNIHFTNMSQFKSYLSDDTVDIL